MLSLTRSRLIPSLSRALPRAQAALYSTPSADASLHVVTNNQGEPKVTAAVAPQSPNYAAVWSENQQPRPTQHSGPRFEQAVMELQPNPLSAMEMINSEPIRMVNGRKAVCDGGARFSRFQDGAVSSHTLSQEEDLLDTLRSISTWYVHLPSPYSVRILTAYTGQARSQGLRVRTLVRAIAISHSPSRLFCGHLFTDTGESLELNLRPITADPYSF